jgi:glycosyltransferase involved in cell wall biosynthesis
MRLLLVTQKVDKQDQILGFFVHWVREFANHFEQLTVICLEKGKYELPNNVKVLSLGKEQKQSRLLYVFHFYKYIWQERKNYDAVFVHMNEEYVILGALLWKILGKKVMLWRNHREGTVLTPWAVKLSNKVFCTSPMSFTAQYAKTRIMPAGIDTSFYTEQPEGSQRNSILFFGRLSPVKNIHIFIEALNFLDKEGFDFKADIIGSPSDPRDNRYEESLKHLGNNLVESGKLLFKSGVSFDETAGLYSKYALYVNLTPDGSLDKTMLEAMASRTPILILNSAFRGKIPEKSQLVSLEVEDASLKMRALLELSDHERKELGETLYQYVEKAHSLTLLVSLLEKEIFEKS